MTLFLSPTLTIISYKLSPDIKSSNAALVEIAALAIKTEFYEKMSENYNSKSKSNIISKTIEKEKKW